MPTLAGAAPLVTFLVLVAVSMVRCDASLHVLVDISLLYSSTHVRLQIRRVQPCVQQSRKPVLRQQMITIPDRDWSAAPWAAPSFDGGAFWHFLVVLSFKAGEGPFGDKEVYLVLFSDNKSR